MGRQDGILKIKGEVGGMSFYKTGDGYLVRQKGGVDSNRIKNDPAFQRTRENGEEFGRAGAAGKLLRTALSSLLKKAADGRMVSRLTKEMMRVLQADETNDRGKRNVIDGEAELLAGFEFNVNAKLSSVISVPFTTAINRAAGTAAITVPAFIPNDMLQAPDGATHCKLLAAAVEVDFEAGTFAVNTSQSGDIAIGTQQQPQVDLANAIPANTTKPVFVVFGIEFTQQVNGKMYSIKSGDSNALAIVAVNGGV